MGGGSMENQGQWGRNPYIEGSFVQNGIAQGCPVRGNLAKSTWLFRLEIPGGKKPTHQITEAGGQADIGFVEIGTSLDISSYCP